MCGIAGLIRFGEKAEENIERMKERMLHRGPDAGGTWKSDDGEVVFGHRRTADAVALRAVCDGLQR